MPRSGRRMKRGRPGKTDKANSRQQTVLLFICPAPPHEAEKGTDYARHGVKLYSQCGCDPREQSAGGKDQR